MWHGLADGAILATSSVGYDDAVKKRWAAARRPKTSSACSSCRACTIAQADLDSPNSTLSHCSRTGSSAVKHPT